MSCVAVGNFDGVHNGHLKIMRSTVAIAKEKNIPAIALTFDTNTKMAFGADLKYITDNGYKKDLILATGIDRVEFRSFTPEIMTMSGLEFIQLLVSDYGMSHIVCGDNFRFGNRASCGINELGKISEQLGIGYTVIKVDGTSSTAIRYAVQCGDMELASRLLGRDFSYGGEFVSGNQIGRTLGFPTLNLSVREEYLLPPNGVYATYCISDGKSYPAVTNIGTRPTVTSETDVFIETHLIGIDEIPEGKENNFSRIWFISGIRPEKKFPDRESLTEQIRSDCKTALNLFSEKHIRS